jgi:hypothetical protein
MSLETIVFVGFGNLLHPVYQGLGLGYGPLLYPHYYIGEDVEVYGLQVPDEQVFPDQVLLIGVIPVSRKQVQKKIVVGMVKRRLHIGSIDEGLYVIEYLPCQPEEHARKSEETAGPGENADPVVRLLQVKPIEPLQCNDAVEEETHRIDHAQGPASFNDKVEEPVFSFIRSGLSFF